MSCSAGCRWIQRFAMRPDALDQMIDSDIAAGLIPACVVATVGTTSSTAIDPVDRIAEVCRRHGAWLHVDAAYAGTAAIVPELRGLFEGVEHADSLVFNPHKWMLVNFDCSAYFVRDTDALLRTFQVTPEYLRTAADSAVVNYRDWGIQLGRRFRALKLWFVIRSYGVSGLQAVVRTHVAHGPGAGSMDRGIIRVRADGASAAGAGLPPLQSAQAKTRCSSTRRAQCSTAGPRERDAPGTPHPHSAGGTLCDSGGCGSAADRPGACGGGLAPPAGRRRYTTGRLIPRGPRLRTSSPCRYRGSPGDSSLPGGSRRVCGPED